ncbi:MAG: hypothetical protein M9894_16205 [Planctomycetes bacterium]|nr:hypothetical protein [Planctomycetota bacterium]
MSVTRVLLFVLLATCAGCGARQIELEERWRPLEAVVEARVPWAEDTTTVTLGTRCYTADLGWWEIAYPEGPHRDALLLHEQEHAVRQAVAGRTWYARYLADPAPEHYAEVLAGYRLPGGRMVSYEDALAWVRDVLSVPERPP